MGCNDGAAAWQHQPRVGPSSTRRESQHPDTCTCTVLVAASYGAAADHFRAGRRRAGRDSGEGECRVTPLTSWWEPLVRPFRWSQLSRSVGYVIGAPPASWEAGVWADRWTTRPAWKTNSQRLGRSTTQKIYPGELSDYCQPIQELSDANVARFVTEILRAQKAPLSSKAQTNG